jgi:aspartyl-tRNA(Asn)/glutamyl-tRNA(Gln) amidotransferase subunit A
VDDSQLNGLTLVEAARRIKRRQVSPTELTQACLDRIERLNPDLNAFLTVMGDQALEQAQYATDAMMKGDYWGPLHGIPIGVKDLIDVEGVRTTAGGTFLKDQVAQDDADVVRQLRGAGAIIIGKTHLHEYAIGATNVNPHYGPARNPWNRDLSPGGSSGGSAVAVVSGMCLGALGTDTGGSVRVPSALCNLTGLRPAVGQVSTQGVIPMSWTLDTVGPMAHTAHDLAVMFEVMTPDLLDCVKALAEPLPDLRLGVMEDDFFQLETEYQVMGAVQQAVDTLVESYSMERVGLSLPQVEAVWKAAGVISLGDAAAYHQERLEEESDRFGDDVRARLEWGMSRSVMDYARAANTGREWRQVIRKLFRDRVDLLIMPTTPVPAPEIAGSEGIAAAKQLLRFTYPFGFSYLPSLSVPCGFTNHGLPVGFQLVGLNSSMLLRVAHAYQQVTDWHTRQPEL